MAVLICRNNRRLDVKEDYATLKGLVAAEGDFIEVTEVKTEVMYKSPTPIDTKAHKHVTEIKHSINKKNIEAIQEDYKAPVFTHRDIECECSDGKTEMTIPDPAPSEDEEEGDADLGGGGL